jgi:uncharacterized protein
MKKVKQLPKTIKLFNFAKKEVNLYGECKISNISRLSEIAKNDNDSIEVDLSFHLENEKTPCVKGIIDLKVVLDCQRCLDDLEMDLRVMFNLAFIRHENQANELDKRYEIYHVGDVEELETLDLITDEILLSIPMAPSHNFECGLKVDQEKTIEEVREHPFDVLKNLK